jgi:poly-gamma-glutamate synthesis protein (capsule biosynthesis protein)
VLALGGDVNLGRECGTAILGDPNYDPFGDLGAAWTSADLRFVNLESQLSEQGGVTQHPRARLVFTGPPGGADVLKRARIDLVSTANNHAWDFGRSAFLQTLANLERAGVAYAGTGRNLAAAYSPAIVKAGDLSIAFFAVTHIWNYGPIAEHQGRDFVAWATPELLRQRIARAKREHDFVLVSYHGGEEYIDAPVEKTRAFVKRVMSLGADAIVGHHPHVPQGVGWFDDRPVLYSLGNFVFAGHTERPWTKQSFFGRLTLQKGAPPALSACPVLIEGHRPRTLDRDRERSLAQRFQRHLELISTSVGGSEIGEPDELGCLPVTPRRRSHPLRADRGSRTPERD